MLKNKTIIFCLPGKTFSGDFMMNLFELLTFLKSEGVQYKISQQYSSMVNYARCKCLGADVSKGKKQNPFDNYNYDYIMWIDSDIIFNIESFKKLVEMDKNIASGWYSQPGNMTPVVEKMNDKFFTKHGHYKFISTKEMIERSDVFKADYIGFGWVLIKKGVFEKIEYPWFAPKIININKNIQEVCSEDVAFCIDAKNSGFEIWLDSTCRVGHEKTLVI